MRRAQDRARSATFKNSGARRSNRAPQARSNLRAAREVRDENVPAKRADFFYYIMKADEVLHLKILSLIQND